jgi:hypothetical protein
VHLFTMTLYLREWTIVISLEGTLIVTLRKCIYSCFNYIIGTVALINRNLRLVLGNCGANNGIMRNSNFGHLSYSGLGRHVSSSCSFNPDCREVNACKCRDW